MTDLIQAARNMLAALMNNERCDDCTEEFTALRSAIEAAERVEPWKPTGTKSEKLWEALGRWSAYIASEGGKANLAPPTYLTEAMDAFTAPAQENQGPVARIEWGPGWEKVLFYKRMGDGGSMVVYSRPTIPPGMCLVSEEEAKNAQRYEWLRENAFYAYNVGLGTDFDGTNYAEFDMKVKVPEGNIPYVGEDGNEWGPSEFDAAIDAAQKEGE